MALGAVLLSTPIALSGALAMAATQGWGIGETLVAYSILGVATLATVLTAAELARA